jgi:CubicO group peptidase (beta-lactamase class C family)
LIDHVDVRVEGTCDGAFKQVRDAFRENFTRRGDTGAGFALVCDGRVVVDLWGGEARPGQPWAANTLVNVWSTTKAVVALAVQILLDRGLLDVDAPVARYWPEFAAAGKQDLPVRYLLSHRAGLCGVREPLTIADLLDWDKITRTLAAMDP